MPSDTTIATWIMLQRAQARVFERVEGALKAAELPKLEWYDVLLELDRGGPTRPRDLQARLLFAQYNLSRLLDRMAAAGVVRREPCPDDRRGAFIAITDTGRKLRKRMWLTYGPAIEAAIGRAFSDDNARTLIQLLDLLAKSPAV